jgi:hypothetical protein
LLSLYNFYPAELEPVVVLLVICIIFGFIVLVLFWCFCCFQIWCFAGRVSLSKTWFSIEMENPNDVLRGLDGHTLTIDFGLPSPLFDLQGDVLLDERDIAGRSFVEIAANLIRPTLRDQSTANLAMTSIHRHFLDQLALDFWPFAHYYADRNFMVAIRSICLDVSKIRLAGFSVWSTADHPGLVVIQDSDLVPIHTFNVEGWSAGSIASMLLRVDSLSSGLASACSSLDL